MIQTAQSPLLTDATFADMKLVRIDIDDVVPRLNHLLDTIDKIPMRAKRFRGQKVAEVKTALLIEDLLVR